MKLLTVIALVVLLAGCYTTASHINEIHLGMTEPEVIKVLGQPTNRAESKDEGVTLNYSLMEQVGVPAQPYYVKLMDGKVDSYGRLGQTKGQPPLYIPPAH